MNDDRLTKIKHQHRAMVDAREADRLEAAARQQRLHAARVRAEQAWPLKRHQLEVVVDEINRELAEVGTHLEIGAPMRSDDRYLEQLDIAYSPRRGGDPMVSIGITVEGVVSIRTGLGNEKPREDTYQLDAITSDDWREPLYTFLERNSPRG